MALRAILGEVGEDCKYEARKRNSSACTYAPAAQHHRTFMASRAKRARTAAWEDSWVLLWLVTAR